MTCPPNQRTSKCKIKPIKSHPVFHNKRARFSCCHCFSFFIPLLPLSYLITLKGKCRIRSGYFPEIKANCFAKWRAGETILHFLFEFPMTLVHMLSRDSIQLIVQSMHSHIIIDENSEKFCALQKTMRL